MILQEDHYRWETLLWCDAALSSSLERGEKKAGASVLLAISREFGKSVDWLLTGQAQNAHDRIKKRNET